MKRLLGRSIRRPTTDAIGGIPVDSEYIIFIIDTSGSMFNYVWPTLLQKIEETLNIYPKVKGFQVMNDEGIYMFSAYPRQVDSRHAGAAQGRDRSAAELERVQQFEPGGGHRRGDPHVSCEGQEDQPVCVRRRVHGQLDRLGGEDGGHDQSRGQDGQRRVRIHAIGFPVRPDAPQYTSMRFATLMRILCQRNGGTFVGIDKS